MTATKTAFNIASTHLRLKSDGRAEPLPAGPDFWPDLMAGKLGTFHHEYLVTTLTFAENWASWEVHPLGDEIVVMLGGEVDFILDTPEGEQLVPVRLPGEFVFVPKGIWHTANVHKPSTMLFITAGEGTQGKARIMKGA